MRILQLLWSADASVNVCPSIHCQSTACMALAFSSSTLTEKRPGLKVLAWVWARAHLCVHGVHQAALHRGCGVRPCRGLCLGAGAVPSAWEKQLRKERPKRPVSLDSGPAVG